MRSLIVGVSFVGFSEPGDGIPGVSYTQCPEVEKSSVVFNFSDPKTTNFEIEGSDEPWEEYDVAGDPDSIDFNIPSPSSADMLAFMGGAVDDGKWSAPTDGVPAIRKSFKLQTKPYKGKYAEYEFAYCKVFAKISQAPGADKTDLLQVRVTKLAAITAAGVKMPSWSRIVKEVAP